MQRRASYCDFIKKRREIKIIQKEKEKEMYVKMCQ